MKRILIGLAAASAAAMTFAATAASAEVVCNRAGECWHADRHYAYDRGVGVVVHPDDWYFHQRWDDKHHFRDYHQGRGYYRDGVWVSF